MFVLRHIRKKRKLMINRLTGGSWPPAEGRQINGGLMAAPHTFTKFSGNLQGMGISATWLTGRAGPGWLCRCRRASTP